MSVALTERPFSKTQLFCSNLPWSVNGKMLRQSFEVHGEVVDAFVAYNGRSSRGFGYVTFKEPAGAASAVSTMNGVPLGDDDRSREIRVEMARERPGPRPEPSQRPSDRPTRAESGGRGERPPRDNNDDRVDAGRPGRGSRGRGEARSGRGEDDGRGRRPSRSARGGRGDAGERAERTKIDLVVAAAAMDRMAVAPSVEDSSES